MKKDSNSKVLVAPYSSTSISMSKNDNENQNSDKKYPKVIVFDLDGCLWTPEMYEINFFMGARGSPFTIDPDDTLNLQTVGGEPVKLLGDVRSIMRVIYLSRQKKNDEYSNVRVGISSRTDEPTWARELLQKFPVPLHTGDDHGEQVTLDQIFNGPIEIAKDSKVEHFYRISNQCNVSMEDILFFDNEYGNCKSVAALGVTVVYCPDGVTEDVWDLGAVEFPRSDGSVVGSEIYGRGW